MEALPFRADIRNITGRRTEATLRSGPIPQVKVAAGASETYRILYSEIGSPVPNILYGLDEELLLKRPYGKDIVPWR